MSELIQSKEELISYLTTKKVASRNLPEFVYVTTKLRQKIMTGDMQAKFINKGRVEEFGFVSIGGGVWKAFIKTRDALNG